MPGIEHIQVFVDFGDVVEVGGVGWAMEVENGLFHAQLSGNHRLEVVVQAIVG
jgi:hypothetical protein